MTATCLPMSGHLGDIIIVKRNFPAYPLLLAQSIVSNALKIIVNFIFVKCAQKILFFFSARNRLFRAKLCPCSGTEFKDLLTSTIIFAQEAL